ncbi:MAG: thiol reductant ABC exporter subunit CydC [Acetobacter papayae]|uniref:thiol reductant ABC exporter subunit CydC n=1 Tax=Acetobacter papayae TaxID=1076592 RepID=UPI0039E8E7DD
MKNANTIGRVSRAGSGILALLMPGGMGLPVFRPVRWHMRLGVVLACTGAVANFGLLTLSGWLLAGAATAGLAGAIAAQSFNILLPATAVRFFATIRILARYLEKVSTHDTALRLTGRLRSWLYARLAPLAPAGLVSVRGGDVLNRFVSDTDRVAGWYTDVAVPCWRALLCGMFFTGIFLCLLPKAAAALGIGLILAAMGVWALLARPVSGLIQRSVESNSALQAELADTLHGLGEWLVLGAMPRQVAKLTTCQTALTRAHRHIAAREGMAGSLVTLVMFCTVVAVLGIAVQAFQAGQLAGPEVPMLVLGTLAAFDVVSALPGACVASARTQLGATRLTACGGESNTTHSLSPAVPAAPYDLEIRDLCFSYPHTGAYVLDHASLTVRQGEKLAIIGPSGAGKSSLVSLLFNFWPVQSGSIVFGGVDISTTDAETLSALISVASQDFHLFTATLRDNLLLAAPQASEADINEALNVAQLTAFVAALPQGLDTLVGNEGLRLSGGQARRLCVAQAVLRRTPWLVLDEPTEGLDEATEQALMQALLAACPRTTILCISHRAGVLPFMDRVVRLEGGRLWPEGEKT